MGKGEMGLKLAEIAGTGARGLGISGARSSVGLIFRGLERRAAAQRTGYALCPGGTNKARTRPRKRARMRAAFLLRLSQSSGPSESAFLEALRALFRNEKGSGLVTR